MTRLACVIALPADYRQADFFRFHQRDAQAIAEGAHRNVLDKGLLWQGEPAHLQMRFSAEQVVAELAIEGEVDTTAHMPIFTSMLQRMLGLSQPTEAFECRYRDHALLGPLIAARPGLRVPITATPFEALSWAIIGQQISVTAAVSIRRRLILCAGRRYASGIMCHPDAAALAAQSEESLRAAGLSTAKAQALSRISRAVLDGSVPLDVWLLAPDAEVMAERLLSLRGIGPWTVSYTLLRGFALMDGSLHGDVAVRSKLQQLLAREGKLSAAETQRWLAEFSPYRALVAAHLWAAPGLG